MTAKTRHGVKAHRHTHGADAGSAHEKMHRMHAMPNRAEGQPMSAATGPSAPPPMNPGASAPQPQDNTSMAPSGAAPGGGQDSEEGDFT